MDAFLMSLTTKRFKTEQLQTYVEKKKGASYWELGGYVRLAREIEEMVDEGVLRPILAWKQNGLIPPLYKGYQFEGYAKPLEEELRKELLTQYHPRIQLLSYFKAPETLKEDRQALACLDAYLKKKTPEPCYIKTINERSFEIFLDEKFLGSASGQAFLHRVGFTLSDLDCQFVYEPFFYYERVRAEKKKAVLFVENKDSFYTVKKLLQEGVSWDNLDVTYLVYGEGNKILRSFPYLNEVEKGPLGLLSFWYFGDLDPSGLRIWYDLSTRSGWKITPMVLFYQKMLALFFHRAPLRKTEQVVNTSILQHFCSFFPEKEQEEIARLLHSKRYIPQEALGGEMLLQLAKEQKESAME